MSLPQLRMRRPNLEGIPEPVELPPGYVLRAARPEDADLLASLLSRSFSEPWDVARVNSVLLESDDVGVVFVVEHSGQIVATASFQTKIEFEGSGWVHYVGAHPDHAGKKLGLAVTRAVLTEAKSRRCGDVYLTTDDARLPAIRTYLREGFAPDLWHESHSERWERVMSKIEGRA